MTERQLKNKGESDRLFSFTFTLLSLVSVIPSSVSLPYPALAPCSCFPGSSSFHLKTLEYENPPAFDTTFVSHKRSGCLPHLSGSLKQLVARARSLFLPLVWGKCLQQWAADSCSLSLALSSSGPWILNSLLHTRTPSTSRTEYNPSQPAPALWCLGHVGLWSGWGDAPTTREHNCGVFGNSPWPVLNSPCSR